MNLFAEIVVAASSVFLIGLAGIMFVKPAMSERFILSFASSARAHYTEMFFRLLFGASLVLLSRTMWQANPFLILGWAIIISSVERRKNESTRCVWISNKKQQHG